MGVQLKPQQSFTVVRQIANHTDTATYYVRAVIRNAYTDALLGTLDLTNRGSQRFSKNWQVPADPSGEGFYISIVTSVYTDSGYTTKSENYGDEENTHLVAQLPTALRMGGGGIDSRTMRRIMEEVIEQIKPRPETKKEEVKDTTKHQETKEPMRWDDVLSAIGELKTAIANIPTEKDDPSVVIDGINQVLQAIAEKDVTPATDLTPVIQKLQEDRQENDITREDIKNIVQGVEDDLTKIIGTEIKTAIGNTQFISQFSTFAAPNQNKPQREESSDIDINQLTQ